MELLCFEINFFPHAIVKGYLNLEHQVFSTWMLSKELHDDGHCMPIFRLFMLMLSRQNDISGFQYSFRHHNQQDKGAQKQARFFVIVFYP